MRLYYAPGSCSMAAHIALREAGLVFELEKVSFGAPHKTESGAPLAGINAKNAVPVLRLEDGEVLTENAVILQYIADQVPQSGLMPAAGTLQRYRLLETLNFIATELHKACFAPLFNPTTPDEYKPLARVNLNKRLDYLEAKIPGNGFILGSSFTIADAYAFVVLNWTHFLGIDLSQWPQLKGLTARVAARPAVVATLKAEGLAN